MHLTNRDIVRELTTQDLYIENYKPGQIRPASVDLRLYKEILRYPRGGMVSRSQRPIAESHIIDPEEGYVIQPGEWFLGATLEVVGIPAHLVGIITGRSSWARWGISVEDAGFVDPKWFGRLTLEIKNNGPLHVTVYPEDLICQIHFIENRTPVLYSLGYDRIEGSHYWGSMGPVESRYGMPSGHVTKE